MLLTEHIKAILRAVADGKQIQSKIDAAGNAHDISMENALKLTANGYGAQLLIAPETRSINGRVFAAPVDGGDWSITSGVLHALSCISWVDQVDRDKAFAAIIDALEGRTK